MTDTFVVVKKGKKFYVKNIKTGKVGSNVFYSQANAEIQRKNRERFIKLIQTKSKTQVNKKDIKKKGKGKK
tara:strand:- start:5647 stop:5859 length:213 start_codon:yes stop_codon:yes gene_type:complete